jgi:hypothetical protein
VTPQAIAVLSDGTVSAVVPLASSTVISPAVPQVGALPQGGAVPQVGVTAGNQAVIVLPNGTVGAVPLGQATTTAITAPATGIGQPGMMTPGQPASGTAIGQQPAPVPGTVQRAPLTGVGGSGAATGTGGTGRGAGVGGGRR